VKIWPAGLWVEKAGVFTGAVVVADVGSRILDQSHEFRDHLGVIGGDISRFRNIGVDLKF